MTAATRTSWLEIASVTLLACGVVLGPLFLGGGWVWSRFGLEAGAVAAVVLWVLAARRGLVFLLSPLVATAILGLQLVPLPPSLLAAVAPYPATLWASVAVEGNPAANTISVDPGLTAMALCRLLLGLSTVAVVADLGRQRACRRILVAALAVCGVMLLVTGAMFPPVPQERLVFKTISLAGPIHQYITPIDEPFQTSGVGGREFVTVGDVRYEADTWGCGDAFGPFIYSNHFSNAFCLTFPVVLGVWLVATQGRVPPVLCYGAVVCGVPFALWLVAVAGACRAGTAALVVACLAFAALSGPSSGVRRCAAGVFLAAVAAVLAFATVLYIPAVRAAFFQAIADTPVHSVMTRLTASRSDAAASIRMFRASPAVGIGLGCFGEVEPRFSDLPARMYFAHNDHGQWLVETGIMGGFLLACGFFMLIRRVAADVKTGVAAECAVQGALWAAVAGLIAHCLFDWNLHMPANAVLASVTAGLAIAGRPRPLDEASSDARAKPPAGRIAGARFGRGFDGRAWLRVGLALGCGVALALLHRDAELMIIRRQLAHASTAARLLPQHGDSTDVEVGLRNALETARPQLSRPQLQSGSANSRLAVLAGQACLHLAAISADPDDTARLVEEASGFFRIARVRGPACRGIPHD